VAALSPTPATAPTGLRTSAAASSVKPVPVERRAAPTSAGARPLALLDLPPARKRMESPAAGVQIASAVQGEASVSAGSASAGKAHAAPTRKRGSRKGLMAKRRSPAPAVQTATDQAGQASGPQISSSVSSGSGSSSELADASVSDRRGLSLRERIPHPAF